MEACPLAQENRPIIPLSHGDNTVMTKNIINDFIKIENAAHDGAFGDNPRAIPTDAQSVAGNYKLGRVTAYGLPIAIEQPRNSYRTGIDQKTGKRWTNRMAAHYGYFSGTKGADGDGVDCFIGFYPQSEYVYIINQFVGGRFDEHKVCLAFPDEQSAINAYLNSYDKGWKGLHSIITASITQFKWWLKNGNMKNPIALNHLPFEGLETMRQQVAWDSTENPKGMTLDKVLYEIKRADGGNNLIFDAICMRDILDDADSVITFDALVTPYAQLERKMQVLKNIMDRSGGAIKTAALQISDPFKQSGVAQVAAVFELSDGQTVSIFFHNPDVDPRKIQQGDELISWKWLLNKKDITIVVAPEKGVDLNIMNVAQRIMKLAEKNSAAFIRANGKRAEKMQAIEDIKVEIVGLEAELKTVLHELEVAKVEAEDVAVVDPVVDPQSVEGDDADPVITPESELTPAPEITPDPAAETEALKQATLQALVDNFGWKNQSTVGGPLFWVTKEIGGGHKGGMVNPDGIRRVSAKFEESSMIAMHGDNVVARSWFDVSKTPEENADELNRVVNSIDPNYVKPDESEVVDPKPELELTPVPEITPDPEVIPEPETIIPTEEQTNEQENEQAEITPETETGGAEGDLVSTKPFDDYVSDANGDLYDAAKNYFKSELQNKVVRTVIGDVYIIGSTFTEMKRGLKRDEIKANLFSFIEPILTNGSYKGKEELNKLRNDSFIAFHFFELDNIKIGEYLVNAGVTVAQRVSGELEFDLSAYGLGHSNEVRWQKRKGGSPLLRSRAEDELPPIESAEPALDSSLDQESESINLIILKVTDLDGNELVELEDDVNEHEQIDEPETENEPIPVTAGSDETITPAGEKSDEMDSQVKEPINEAQAVEDLAPAVSEAAIEPQVNPIKAGFEAELEALKLETDIETYDKRLDEIYERIEAAGLAEEMDAKLHETADVLTELLMEAEKNFQE